MPLIQTVTIAAIRQEAEDVKTFELTSIDGSGITYEAGQFLTFAFTHHNKEERRSFSISSSPVLPEPLSVTVKRVDNGAYSRLLIDRAKVGDDLFSTGAGGLFTFERAPNHYRQVFFLAAGIGITPIFSLIKTLLHSRPDLQLVLIYSNRRREDAVFYYRLNALAEQFPNNLKIEFLYSSSFDLSRARLSKLLLPTLLKEYAAAPVSDMLFYICGPFTYMRMAVITLEELGIKDEQIKRENFNTNDRQVRKVEPPDKTTHAVTIVHSGRETTIAVSYPDTILQAAKRHGLALPFSCEAGRCGSCVAQCTKGSVWLSYNEVLTEADLKKGRILTCVGHPINGDVTIEA